MPILKWLRYVSKGYKKDCVYLYIHIYSTYVKYIYIYMYFFVQLMKCFEFQKFTPLRPKKM